MLTPIVYQVSSCSTVKHCVDTIVFCTDDILTLISVSIKAGLLPISDIAIACGQHWLGFLSTTILSPLEATFWHSICYSTASMLSNIGMFSNSNDSETLEDALMAMSPKSCEEWSAVLWRHMRPSAAAAEGEEGGSDGARVGGTGTAASGAYLPTLLN